MALLTKGTTLEDICCQEYEVANCEPLHDLKNVIHIILNEFAIIVEQKELRRQVQEFCKQTVGMKSTLKGCDARLFLINLTKMFMGDNFQCDPQCCKVSRMLISLTEIQRLAYQLEDQRCSRDLLHMTLMTLRFSTAYTSIFSGAKSSTRRIFGTPYHSVVAHMPETYRLISLRSLVAEASERLFHELRYNRNGSV